MRSVAMVCSMLVLLSWGALPLPAGEVFPYRYPDSAPQAQDYTVLVNGQEVFVYNTEPAAVASFSFTGTVEVEVRPSRDVKWVTIRPLSRQVRWTLQKNVIRFRLDRPVQLSLELNGETSRPLYIFANPLATDRPNPADPQVIYYRAGKTYDVGFLQLKSGQTVYLEGGAIVRGAILAEDAHDITVRGYGIIDGSLWGYKKTRLVRFLRCRNLRLEGLILVDSPGWTVVVKECDGVAIENLKQVCWRYGTDGIDLVGSSNVVIRNCFLRNNDENVVIKSWRTELAHGSRSLQGPVVENILVEGCTIWNMAWGNGLEIGFELRCPAVRQVTFRDIDIIHVEHSAATSIHNGDWATVEEVAYEDIRVEDARHKLFDFAIFPSQYSADRHPGPGERERRYLHGAWDGVQDVRFYGKKEHAAYRGHIRNIQVRNVRVVDGPIPFSILCGYDRDHTVEDVIFENLRFYDQKVTGAAEGRFTVEQARGVVFR